MRRFGSWTVAVWALTSVLLASGATAAATGSVFVFVRQQAPSYSAIYVAKTDGTGVRRLTSQLPRSQASAPVWSPDGSKIAYILSARPGAVVMNTDGSGKRPLCDDHSDSLVELLCAASGKSAPAWSPDGRQVAFGLVAAFSHDRGVAIVNAGGAGLRFVPGTRRFQVSGLDWSPDGRRLAIAASVRAPGEVPWGLTYRIWVIGIDGSGLRLLVRDAGPNPRWSPDGKTVLFAKHDGRGIYAVGARGGKPRLIRMSTKDTYVSSATWSPDGTEIAFFENGAAGSRLHVLRLRDRQDHLVTLRPPICTPSGVGCFEVDWKASRPEALAAHSITKP